MDFRTFTFGLGDLVLGYQVLESNLVSIFGKKDSLKDYASDLEKAFPNSGLEKELLDVAGVKGFLMNEVGLTFMDEEDFEQSPAFEKACNSLIKTRKQIYEINGKVASFVSEHPQTKPLS